MSAQSPTLIGEVQSVAGATVTVRLYGGQSSLVLVDGASYRVGQVGSFLRIPLGYTNLFGVCAQVGAVAAPVATDQSPNLDGRWLTLSLFGESVGGDFQRGIGQFPTIGDQVHLVTTRELEQVYGSAEVATPLTIGKIASATGIDATVDLSRLVARHSALVGSSGSGKSNFVAVILNAIARQDYPSARVVVIDPHGEYSAAVGDLGRVFSATPSDDQQLLSVPFWAMPFDELMDATLGELNSANESVVRAEVESLRLTAAAMLGTPPPPTSVSADSPIPFSIKQLWADLIDFENRSYTDNSCSTPTPVTTGDPDDLVPNTYPAPALGSGAPFKGPKRGITRNLELLRNRLRDSRYRFLFEPGESLTPSLNGAITGDLDQLVASWVGHDRPITVFDLSTTPSDVLSLVAGSVLRMIYDALFWANDLDSGGRRQPLLVILEEAHLFLPEGEQSSAQRTVAKIAKEGRKYGVGIMLVTQRPTELDSTALSQCGTLMAMRLTNSADRARVTASLPDELAGFSAVLPALRTGEAILTGEAIAIPSRIRVPNSPNKIVGSDPDLATGWRAERPLVAGYTTALSNWRALSFVGQITNTTPAP